MAESKSPENWPGAFKAVGVKALTTGKFWQFCFLCIALMFAYRIDSSDWVRIADLLLSKRWVAASGWFAVGFLVLGSIVLFRFQRSVYQREIDRIIEHRNALQKQLTGTEFPSSVHRLPDSSRKSRRGRK